MTRLMEFQAELLTRVHHRYLVTLLGYCKENLALVYEFVQQGSLADHLSGTLSQKIKNYSLQKFLCSLLSYYAAQVTRAIPTFYVGLIDLGLPLSLLKVTSIH